MPIQKLAAIAVHTDNMLGFKALARGDKLREQLHIILDSLDYFNKNANTVADRHCQKLELKIWKRLLPSHLAAVVIAHYRK